MAEAATQAAAAMTIQNSFRVHKAKKELVVRKAACQVDGDIIATIPKAAVWKMCGAEKELVAAGAAVYIVKTYASGKPVHYLWLDHENAEASGVFPCPLHTDLMVVRHSSNYFMFPTIEFSKKLFVGIVAKVKGPDFDKFVTIIEITSQLKDSEALAAAKGNAAKATAVVKKGIGFMKVGTTMASGYIVKGGGWLKTKVAPGAKDVKVNDSTVATVHAAKIGAEKAVQMSALAASVVQTMALSMSHALVENIESQEQYQELVAKTHTTKPPSSLMTAGKIYAGTAVIGYDMLYEAMWDSAQELVEVSGDTAAEVVEVKYGHQCGSLAHDCAHIASDATKVGRNVGKIGYKPVVKMVAKETAKELAVGAIENK